MPRLTRNEYIGSIKRRAGRQRERRSNTENAQKTISHVWLYPSHLDKT